MIHLLSISWEFNKLEGFLKLSIQFWVVDAIFALIEFVLGMKSVCLMLQKISTIYILL